MFCMELKVNKNVRIQLLVRKGSSFFVENAYSFMLRVYSYCLNVEESWIYDHELNF